MKEAIRRALRTAFQTAIGYIVVALPAVDWSADRAALRASLVGIGVTAASAGLAAAMNYTKEDEE